MRHEELQLLLITKVPINDRTQAEILEAFDDSCSGRRMDDYLILLRAVYMNVPEIITRQRFYLNLAEKLKKHLQQNPQLASGPTGLYINFLAEDFQKTKDQDLVRVGRDLEMAMRMATNPAMRPVEGRRLASLPSIPMAPEDAFREPQTWIDKLAACEDLFKDEGIAPLLRELAAGGRKRGRENANRLVLIGSHFEMTGYPDWARGCYRASAALDDTLDLPWAFLAGLEPKPQDALACGNRAVRINPRSLVGLRNRGRVLGRLSRFSEAMRDLAEVARFDTENPRALFECAQASLDAGYALISMRLYQNLARRFPSLPETWHGMARLFWRSGLPENARICQEKVRALTFGEIPRELWLSGRLDIQSPTPETSIFLDDQKVGKGRVQLAEAKPGEHRLRWESGPSRRFFLEEGECLRLLWMGKSDEITIQTFVPDVANWNVNPAVEDKSFSPADSLLKPYLERKPGEWPYEKDVAAILTGIPGPMSPFGTEGRLTIESVFRLFLEEILADGVLDHAEHDLIRALRYRLLIDSQRFRVIMEEARKKVIKTRSQEKSGHLDNRSLYSRVYRKAREDGIIDPSEKILMVVIAECLFLGKDDIECIEAEAELASGNPDS